MRFEVFGPVRVVDGGADVAVPEGKLRLLLAVLLGSAGDPVSVSTLAETVWHGADPESIRRTVRWHIHRLRQLLLDPARIQWGGGGYRLSVRSGELDIDQFREWCETGMAARREGRPEHAKRSLGRALDLRRGPAFGELAEDCAWLARRAAPLERLHLEATEQWIAARMELGEHTELVPRLTELVAQYPQREPLRAQLMRAMFHCGLRSEALEVYREGREVLIRQLGLEPGDELRRMHREILAGNVPVPPPKRQPVPRELPCAPTGFAGRQAEVAELAEALSRPAGTVAITGAGGLGKSALAIELANRVADGFRDGQLYINLRGNSPSAKPLDPDELLGRFLRSLGVTGLPPTGDVDELAARLRTATAGKRLLIVLDDAVDANQIRPLLPPGRDSAVLVTSRRGLPLLDNVTHRPITGLDVDASIALLAGYLGAERVATEPQATSRLVRWCGGIPLALTICAARLAARPHWSIAVLADLLADERERLSVLADGDVAIRSSFAVSYRELFDDPDGVAAARLFRLLGLYPGGDIAVEVAAALADLTERRAWALLEKLVDARLAEPAGERRYRLHDLLRLYARELTEHEDDENERDSAVRRMLHFYCETAGRCLEHADPMVKGPLRFRSASPWRSGRPIADVAEALAWIDAEHANLSQVCRTTSLVASDFPAAFGSCLIVGHALLDMGDQRVVLRLLEIGVRVAEESGDPALRRPAHSALGLALRAQGRLSEAREHLLTAVAVGRADGAESALASTYGSLASVSRRLGDLDEARRYAELSAELSHRDGNVANESRAHIQLGFIHEAAGDTEAAVAAHDRARRIARDGGNLVNELGAMGNIAHTLRRAGKVGEATELFDTAIRKAAEHDMERSVPAADLLWGLSECHRIAGRADEARRRRRSSADVLLGLNAISDADHQAIVTADNPVAPPILR